MWYHISYIFYLCKHSRLIELGASCFIRSTSWELLPITLTPAGQTNHWALYTTGLLSLRRHVSCHQTPSQLFPPSSAVDHSVGETGERVSMHMRGKSQLGLWQWLAHSCRERTPYVSSPGTWGYGYGWLFAAAMGCFVWSTKPPSLHTRCVPLCTQVICVQPYMAHIVSNCCLQNYQNFPPSKLFYQS